MSSANSVPVVSWSLRRRLLIRLLIVVSLLWAATSALALLSAHYSTTEQLDDNLRRAASLLMGFAEHEYAETAGSSLAGVSASAELPHGGYLYQIWSEKGRLMLRSQEGPQAPIGSDAEGYTNIRYANKTWRLYSVWNATYSLHLLLAEPQQQRQNALTNLSLSLLLPMLLVLPLLALLKWAALTKGLQPAQEAAELLAQRSEDDFNSIPLSSFPQELQGLVSAFNALLVRLANALKNERQFAEDVAHELRTPLAAIRLQAQLIERAPDEAATRHALSRLISGVDRTVRLVDQLLTLARLDPERAADQDQQDFSLKRIVEEMVGEFENTVRQNAQRIILEVSSDAIRSSPHAVYVVLRNLLDNALRYTPRGGAVHLQAGSAEGELILMVSDEGPGIPVAERKRVMERFTRLQSDNAGSGLGLFIVHRIAETAGGSILIAEVLPTGTRVTVRWPLRN